MLRFAMLGSGNGARAWCAQISAAGYPIVMWEPLDNVPDFPTLHEKKRFPSSETFRSQDTFTL